MKVKRVDTVMGHFYGWQFICPGCKGPHLLPTSESPPSLVVARWTFNGNPDKPSFTPSILARYYEPTEEGEAMMDRQDPVPPGMDRYPGRDMVCHSFVTDGSIRFLPDSTHELAGQTVELPELPELTE